LTSPSASRFDAGFDTAVLAGMFTTLDWLADDEIGPGRSGRRLT
jgi:hypothetical protein